MGRRIVRLTVRAVATVVLCGVFANRDAHSSEPWPAAGVVAASGLDAALAHPVGDDLEYGPHGGVIGLAPGSYVCVVYDARRRSCLVRAITEAEIVHAIDAAETPNGPPGWMRASVDMAVSAAAVGLPVDNAYRLPGLMTESLSTAQIAMVHCLANSELGRALAQWDDASIYREGIVERCAEENDFEGGTTRRSSPVLPLAARHIQEAVAIVVVAQRLSAANISYSRYAGRFAGSVSELLASAMIPAMPVATPLMTPRGYEVLRGNRVVVDLKAQAVDVCRALNMIHGRPWVALPEALPAGYRAGCYPAGGGYRFEYRS